MADNNISHCILSNNIHMYGTDRIINMMDRLVTIAAFIITIAYMLYVMANYRIPL